MFFSYHHSCTYFFGFGLYALSYACKLTYTPSHLHSVMGLFLSGLVLHKPMYIVILTLYLSPTGCHKSKYFVSSLFPRQKAIDGTKLLVTRSAPQGSVFEALRRIMIRDRIDNYVAYAKIKTYLIRTLDMKKSKTVPLTGDGATLVTNELDPPIPRTLKCGVTIR